MQRYIILTFLTLFMITLVTVRESWCHEHPCKHTHSLFPGVATCDDKGAACKVKNCSGKCRTQVLPSLTPASACICDIGKGCFGFAKVAFAVEGGVVPSTGMTAIYYAIPGSADLAAIVGTLPLEIPAHGLAGEVILSYSSNLDSALLLALSLAIPPFGPAKEEVFVYSTRTQTLSYDASTNRLESGPEGLELQTNVDGLTVPVTAYLSAEIQTDGNATVEVQVVGPGPVFFDNFEDGDTSRWSAVVAWFRERFGMAEREAVEVAKEGVSGGAAGGRRRVQGGSRRPVRTVEVLSTPEASLDLQPIR